MRLSMPEDAEAEEYDEGFDFFFEDGTVLMVYDYGETVDETSAEETFDTVLEDYLVGSDLADAYEILFASGEANMYNADFTYTSADFGDGEGILTLVDADDTAYLVLLASPDLANHQETFSLALGSMYVEGEPVVDAGIPAGAEETEDEAAATGEEAATDATPADEATWLILLYSDADDQVLEHDIFIDLNEVERVGSNADIHIVAQIDRYDGAFEGDGDWTGTRRYYVTSDDDINTLNSELLEDMGEVNMGDEETLVDFATWAIENYPAQKHAIIFSDHGAGWPGGWNDPDPPVSGNSGTPLDANGDMLVLPEIANGLERIVQETGIGQFELVGFDACLMSHIEVYAAIAPAARYAVASQETEPAMGWAYASFLQKLADNPAMDGAELGQNIVESYITEDLRIVDDQARQEFLSAMGVEGDFTPAEVAEYFGNDITLTAVNLQSIPLLLTTLDGMIEALQEIDQSSVAAARTYAQSFDHYFGQEIPSSYLDMAHFAAVVAQESGDGTVQAVTEELFNAYQQVIVAEKHGPARPAATGISIYFPILELYESEEGGGSYDVYDTIAANFAENSQWDEFLDYHYTGGIVAEEAPLDDLQPGSRSFTAPGASQLSVAPLQPSETEVAAEESIDIDTEIQGDNISFIYIYLGYYDEDANAIQVADLDFLDAEATIEVNGIIYPDWGSERPIPLTYEFEPVIYEITNGDESAFAVLQPEDYGMGEEDTTYYVEGIYTFTKDNEQRYADLIFDGTGRLLKVIGYAGEEGTGAPRQITPQPGDTFTVLEQWYQLSEDGEEEIEEYEEEGDILTFGDTPFTWEPVIAPPGDYEVGIIVEDMDGNFYEEFVEVTVTE
jgi:hypothetical protein